MYTYVYVYIHMRLVETFSGVAKHHDRKSSLHIYQKSSLHIYLTLKALTESPSHDKKGSVHIQKEFYIHISHVEAPDEDAEP